MSALRNACCAKFPIQNARPTGCLEVEDVTPAPLTAGNGPIAKSRSAKANARARSDERALTLGLEGEVG